MSAVVLVVHLILALAIIVLVLLQRSEGGGLGIGGGGGGLGGLATPQATANVMTRATWICAGCFLVTSLTLGIFASYGNTKGQSIIDRLNAPAPSASVPVEPTPPTVPTSE
jgi:preprotein translocase subunit SecG